MQQDKHIYTENYNTVRMYTIKCNPTEVTFLTEFCNELTVGSTFSVDGFFNSLGFEVVENSSLTKFADSSWGTDDVSISSSCKNYKSNLFTSQ